MLKPNSLWIKYILQKMSIYYTILFPIAKKGNQVASCKIEMCGNFLFSVF